MKRVILLAPMLLLTSCLTTLEKKPQGTLTLPPPGAVNIQAWEPKGCEQINEWAAFQSCEYMDQQACEKRVDTQIANYSAIQKGTHFYVIESGKHGSEFYKKGIIYNCTALLSKGKKG